MEAKEQILKGATEMFMKYGVKSITMDDISRSLSVSKKTIYQFYEDKDQLCCASVDFVCHQQKLEMISIKEKSRNVIEELINLSEYLKRNVCNINPALMYDLKKYHQGAFKIYEQFKKEIVKDFLIVTLEEGVKTGHFRKDMDVQIIAKLRIEQIEMAFDPEKFPVQDFDTTRVHLQFFDHFVYGISTLKGHRLLNKYKQINEED